MYLIAVWGSSGAGKTALSLALASAFAENKKDTLILSSDTRTPALPVLLPMVKDIHGGNSIGPLLINPDLTDASLKDRMVRHPKSSHIFCMGYASGETATFSYGLPTRAAAINLFQVLSQSPFDFVIVDCDSSPAYDQTTLAALEYAHSGLMVLTPDVKGYEFQKAQLGWLANSDVFQFDKYMKIAAPVYPFTPLADARALFGGFDYELPHAQEVAERMMAGELIVKFTLGPGVRYLQQIRMLAERLEKEAADRA